MSITFINSKGEASEMTKEQFREKFLKKGVHKMEKVTTTEKTAVKRTVIPSVASKSEKDTEKRNLAKILGEAFASANIDFASTGKTGEFAIRMPHADYTIKITAKKERLDVFEK